MASDYPIGIFKLFLNFEYIHQHIPPFLLAVSYLLAFTGSATVVLFMFMLKFIFVKCVVLFNESESVQVFFASLFIYYGTPFGDMLIFFLSLGAR